MKKHCKFTVAAMLLAGISAFAGSPAAPYDNSRIDARLNVSVKENTDVVHFVRDNADPNVITKAYEIKYTDPYELRSYIRAIVQTRKVNTCNTNVEAITYDDGSALLLISAEDYRFADTPSAQGFDTIVKELDKPKLVASSGRKTYVYAPKFRSSAELMEMVYNIGAYSRSIPMNNIGGTDVVMEDAGLNLLFFNTAPFSCKTITDVLKEYDRPYPAIRAKVTVYELYAENDTKLGMDFQAWKNNEGIDLFSAGGRFSRNHNGVDLVSGAKWNDATYFQFNPKWNTKYIDFLTSKGKAKVLHTSELTLSNNIPGIISKETQVFLAQNDNDQIADNGTKITYHKNFTETAGTLTSTVNVVGVDLHDRQISFDTAGTKIVALKTGKAPNVRYTLRVNNADPGNFVDANGNIIGKKVELKSVVTAVSNALAPVALGHKSNGPINFKASSKFGFNIVLTPSISSKATMLNVKINNSSLIGYTSGGMPRIQENAEIDTDFMIANKGAKLVIGGIEKRSVMRVSGGLPFLKDLPVLGWIFSTETEATKRSQLLVVAEIIPTDKKSANSELIKQANDALKSAGVSNSYGYRQYGIDADRK